MGQAYTPGLKVTNRITHDVRRILPIHGEVLVQKGELEEGLKHLTTAYRHSSDATARGTVACWIAMGKTRDGRRDEARKWLETARRSCPELALLARVEGELEAAA